MPRTLQGAGAFLCSTSLAGIGYTVQDNFFADGSPSLLAMTAFQLQHPEHEALRQELLQRYRTSAHNCAQFSRALAERFSSLKAVAGFYFSPNGASRGEHWWTEDADGNIIDPTADQFPCQGAGRYVRYSPNLHKTVKGKCMGCGAGLYSRTGIYPCSLGCAEMLAKEYGIRVAPGPYEDEMEFETDAELTEKYGITFQPPF